MSLKKSKLNSGNIKNSQFFNSIVINLAHCKYDIIHKIAKEDFRMKIVKNQNSQNWDVFWSDLNMFKD